MNKSTKRRTTALTMGTFVDFWLMQQNLVSRFISALATSLDSAMTPQRRTTRMIWRIFAWPREGKRWDRRSKRWKSKLTCCNDKVATYECDSRAACRVNILGYNRMCLKVLHNPPPLLRGVKMRWRRFDRYVPSKTNRMLSRWTETMKGKLTASKHTTCCSPHGQWGGKTRNYQSNQYNFENAFGPIGSFQPSALEVLPYHLLRL